MLEEPLKRILLVALASGAAAAIGAKIGELIVQKLVATLDPGPAPTSTDA